MIDDPAPAPPPCSCERCPGAGPARCARFERWAQRAEAASVMQRGRYTRMLESASAGSPHLPPEKERQLKLDIDRTWPSLTSGLFREGGGGRQKLSNLLRAWVMYDGEESSKVDEASAPVRPLGTTAVGYVQGMNFIATALLWHTGLDEAAFWLFVAMVQHYGLRSMFEAPDMHGLKVKSFTIAQLVHQEMPELSAHLAEHLQNSLSLLFTEWLLTLFASSVPLAPLADLWDQFFEEGYGVIYRLILARLRSLRLWLLAETDFGSLVHLVKQAHVDFIGADQQPRPRPSLLGLAGSAPAMQSFTSPERSRRFSLRRLMRSPPSATKNSSWHGSPSASTGRDRRPDGSDGSEEDGDCRDAGDRPPCPGCEGGGGETCSSWQVLVTDLLQAELLDAQRTEHFERMVSSGGDDECFIGNALPRLSMAVVCRAALK
ncbi:unnamed protein product, partial [Polarella glacialis]